MAMFFHIHIHIYYTIVWGLFCLLYNCLTWTCLVYYTIAWGGVPGIIGEKLIRATLAYLLNSIHFVVIFHDSRQENGFNEMSPTRRTREPCIDTY